MKRTHISEHYNWVFDDETGFFMRWGKTLRDDPVYSEVGPEILDIEISTICHNGCTFCYKSNTSKGEYMSFETYKIILDKMKGNLTQVALGVGDIDYDIPTLMKIMGYTRKLGIIPNITINGSRLTPEIRFLLTSMCGAISVSNYEINNTIKVVNELLGGCDQVNIHQLVAKESLPFIEELIAELADGAMPRLHAVTFLSLKPKGENNYFSSLEMLEYTQLLDKITDLNKFRPELGIGFDSCFAPIILYLTGTKYATSIEPCEGGLFSSYVDIKGNFYPCSFTEKMEGWEKGISVVDCEDFLKDVWFSMETELWRSKLLVTSRATCPNCDVNQYCRPCLSFPEINDCKYVIKN